MRDYKTLCDLCKEPISETDYLVLKYSPPEKYLVFFKRGRETKELDVCKNCINKMIDKI